MGNALLGKILIAKSSFSCVLTILVQLLVQVADVHRLVGWDVHAWIPNAT
ncbi:hypothetical protein F751_3758 [Auxenochlorella protothecoides]|uniref:Uncharacterized protein n=1 Tax=Auxenochlorella protothecoides TaxID=3075 RepID=A0A087SG92_AUXPR|nr:hypothetical protein F751_3758 [Auxenochlorella protothecoides]KFM24746.1 hypothetical protein F751_3758 [Auxenochlorella protothecoides]